MSSSKNRARERPWRNRRVYLTKYGRYGNTYVQPMIDTETAEATFRLLPR
jgi:hypothetical protein